MPIFIIKPIGFYCNLRCDYCFYRQYSEYQHRQTIMPKEIVEKVVSEILRVNPKLAIFNWLGGETLLLGLKFYQKIIELQEKLKNPGQKVINKLQTNGTLINDDWAAFFAKNKFHVGISLDGPQKFHDAYRRDIKGKSVFYKIMNNIKLLQNHQVSFGTISVVNNFNVEHPDEMFDFFLSHGIKRFSFNHTKGCQNEKFAVNPLKFGQFLIRIFDLWIEKDDPEIVNREIKSVIQAYLGGIYRLCIIGNHCHKFYGISYDGNVYPCEDEPVQNIYHYGNIMDGFESLLKSDGRKKFIRKITELKKECHACAFWKICKGGCAKDYNIYSITPYKYNSMCKGYQLFFEHVHSVLKQFNLIV